MDVIPVIDLMHGQVVHARHGDRSDYAPLKSCLTRSVKADDIMQALLNLFPFRTIYIADLDAIQGTGSHSELINTLYQRYPEIDFWIDRGIGNINDLGKYSSQESVVIGTETIQSGQLAEQLASVKSHRIILSLDFKNNELVGPVELLNDPALWPENIIIMSLDAVGSNNGADMDRLKYYRDLAPERNWYVAGGVRDVQDLQLISKQGAAGVLVASAVHSGSITCRDLMQFISN